MSVVFLVYTGARILGPVVSCVHCRMDMALGSA